MTDATEMLSGLAERRLERRGIRLRYYAGGAEGGPPILLVHGFGGSAWTYCELAPLLAARRRVLIPDLPGHGGSAPLPAAPNLAAYADSLVTLCHEEGVERADVVGHSLGGALALRLAVRRPALVRRLVLAGAAGISSSTRAAELLLTSVSLVRPGRLTARYPHHVARSPRLRRLVLGEFWVSDPAALSDRAVVGVLRGGALHTDLLSAGDALVHGDPRSDLDRVACPVLCLWGARDRQVPVADAFEYARRLHARLRVIAACGHLLIVERADVCADAIETFLS